MRNAVLAALLLALVSPALAQTQFTPPGTAPEIQPDYSRETLLELFADLPEPEDLPNRGIDHQFGAISFRALGARFRIGYLPFFMPLSGSRPWLNSDRWPDPFTLTGAQYATTPRSFRTRREMSSELRRIERKVRESATVTVKP